MGSPPLHPKRGWVQCKDRPLCLRRSSKSMWQLSSHVCSVSNRTKLNPLYLYVLLFRREIASTIAVHTKSTYEKSLVGV